MPFSPFSRLLTLCILSPFALFAGTSIPSPQSAPIEEPATFCDHYYDVLDLASLYDGDGPLIQEVRLTGLYHGQYHHLESQLGDDSDWENRRFRFGLAAKFLDTFQFQGQFNVRTDFNDSERLFKDVELLTLTWEPSDFWSVTLGKRRPHITREYSTSSKFIKTPEHSQLVNQVVPVRAGGAVITFHDIGGNVLDLGIFSGALTDNWALPDFDAGYALYGRIARGISDATEVRFDYLYEDGSPENNAFRDYEHIFSLNSLSDWNRWHLVTDLIYAVGEAGTPDAYSAVLMPYFDLTDSLELVFRLTYSGAEDPTGVRVQRRYESAASDLRGDHYLAFYLGLNFYLCGDNLKLMNGVEFSHLSGPSDNQYTTFFSGIRMYF